MDDELEQFEAELKQLRPRAVPPSLTSRVAQAIGPCRAAAHAPSFRWVAWAVLPAAAALAFILRPSAPVPSADAVAARERGEGALRPIFAEHVLVAANDEGVVTLSDGTPARRSRLHYVDTITWKNPRTHASLTWSVPREEVRVVPLLFQ